MDEILRYLQMIQTQLAEQSILLMRVLEVLAEEDDAELSDLDGNLTMCAERDLNQPL